MKKLIGSLILILTLFGSYILVSPYIVVHQMREAIRNQDGESLCKYVEFPELRQNIKGDLSAHMLKEMAKLKAEGNPFAGLGLILGNALINTIIESFINPSVIMMLMEKGNTNNISDEKVKYSTSYKAFNKFVISVKNIDTNDEVKFILSRKGISWKLTKMILPSQIFEDL